MRDYLKWQIYDRAIERGDQGKYDRPPRANPPDEATQRLFPNLYPVKDKKKKKNVKEENQK